jgi:NADP-dependent aldehyde dehydrogenase
MELHGKNIIAGVAVDAATDKTFTGLNPANSQTLEPAYHEASLEQINAAAEAAAQAFDAYRSSSPEQRAAFLERIGDEIVALGDVLLERANAESGLPLARLTGERGRTVGQLKQFAALIREGSWVEARMDLAQPERQPLPKPDIRRMLIPIGPVAVFAASNFPLAFSVAGGDTASALAAGCPVVVKAHPAHPGTSEMVARAIATAAEATGMPAGVFSLVHSVSHEVGTALVKHPAIKAVGFTGSLRGGRALFDAAAARPEPIPVFAEMGSINPVFILPGALAERGEAIATGLKDSVTLGVGQFCTCPGLAVGLKDAAFTNFSDKLNELFAEAPTATMLYPAIAQAYSAGVRKLAHLEGVATTQTKQTAEMSKTHAAPTVFTTDAATFNAHHELSEEVFGPSTVVVSCGSREELESIARNLEGHLTATIHGTAADLAEHKTLVDILATKAGRLIFNGYPTGVEVCPAMQHGGPYPATTDARTTSVGTAAIARFARPVAYQSFPQEALPVELRNQNARKLWRLVDGALTQADC